MGDAQPQITAEGVPLPNTSLPPYVKGLLKFPINYQEFLEEDVLQCGLRIKELEDNIQWFENDKSKTMKELNKLQAHLDVDYSHQQECTAEKKLVMEQIGCNSGSAASVVCNILQSIDTHDVNCEFASNVLGVVAILGTVQTNNLSRILAKYLGEDQMLAIVCKSTKYASDLVKHGPNGQINSDVGLHALATKLGLPINKQYVVISLENTRAYAGEISNNHLRKLALPDPILANGSPPPGYLGYAVNMIELDSSFWHWKTPSGHSLRETLFYHLFGDLQVYENREAMNRATYCIMHAGAVSLDGGAMKHGVVTIGNCDPNIQFPVICSSNQMHFSAKKIEITMLIEEKKQILEEINDLLKREKEKHTMVLKKFWKKHDRYSKFLDEAGDSLLAPCFRHLQSLSLTNSNG